MCNVEKLFEQIEAVNLGRYGINFDEATALCERLRNTPYELLYAAFRYGFLKGEKATKAQMKTKAGVR